MMMKLSKKFWNTLQFKLYSKEFFFWLELNLSINQLFRYFWQKKIGEKLAYVLTGGDMAGLTKSVDEQYLLDIEREAFVSLAGEQLTQNRIKYTLKKGKPLRN